MGGWFELPGELRPRLGERKVENMLETSAETEAPISSVLFLDIKAMTYPRRMGEKLYSIFSSE